MENNNNGAPVAELTENGSADSFITDDNSKDAVAADQNAEAGGDDGNLSPISDSELEDDVTNDTTDARPVSPPAIDAEPISQSNDGVVNDNDSKGDSLASEEKEGNTKSVPGDEEAAAEDVEMKDVEESQEAEPTIPEKSVAEDVDRENNNQSPPPPETDETSKATAAEEEEPMDVDETDKGEKSKKTSEEHVEQDGGVDIENSTNVSTSDVQEGHFQAMTGSESANVSTSGNQPDADMLTDMMNTTETQPGEEENPEQNVQEIEIGTFRDVTVTTAVTLNREDFDKIIEQTQKNIILESAWKTQEIPRPAARTPLIENEEIREMDDSEQLQSEMASVPCLRCLEEKPAVYKMARGNEWDFFCSTDCATQFKEASSLSDVLMITQKRSTIVRFPLVDPKKCFVCEKEDAVCRFKFLDPVTSEDRFLCDSDCVDKYTERNWDKFAVHLGWFDVESIVSEELCSKCGTENKPCTLKLFQVGGVKNEYLICDETCRDAVIQDLPVDAQAKKPEFVLHLDDLDESIVDDELPLPRSSADAEQVRESQLATFARKCRQCSSTIEEAGLSNIHWQFMDFCCGDCLLEFNKATLAKPGGEQLVGSCASCGEEMAVDDKVVRFTILHGSASKAFCNESCLVRYKDTHRVCWSCTKSVAKEEAAEDAERSEWEQLVSNEGAEKRFCSDECDKRFSRTIARVKLTATVDNDTNVLCHVCNHEKPIAVTCQVNNRVITLCSQACFSAFKFANSVDPSPCRTCNRFFERSAKREFTMCSYSGDTSEAYAFCTRSCRDLYVARDACGHVMDCSWCGITKRECDLVRLRSFGEPYKPALVCSVECERLLRFVVDQRTQRLNDTWSCTFCQKTADFGVQRRLILLPAIIGDSSSWRSFCSSSCARSSVGEDLLDEAKFEESLRRLTNDALSQLVEKLLKPRPTLSVRDDGALLKSRGVGDDEEEDAFDNHQYDDGDHFGSPRSPLPLKRRGRPRRKDQVKIPTEPLHPRLPTNAPAPEIRTQIITVGPPPTLVRNCATMCRPKTESRGTMARPKKVSVECQTESHLERRYFIPVPVPIYVPTPLPMYSLPVPTPVPIPIPIPVPIFIPTTRNSAEGIMKEIKKIQDKMPQDPYEAELLLMAEMVADDAAKDDNSDSDSEDDRPLKSLATTNNHGGHQMVVPEYHHLGSHAVAAHATVGGGATGMEGEDMLMMALKMAYDTEPAVDLEASMTANTISQAHEAATAAHHQHQYTDPHQMMGMHHGQQQHHHQQDAYGNIIGGHHQQQQQQQQGHSLLLLESAHHMQQQQPQEVQQVTRGRKRGSGRNATANARNVQAAMPVIQTPPNKRASRNRSPPVQQQPQQQASAQYMAEQHQREMERAESNMCLKYTFGVNAWKQWVTNERNMARRKPLKTDLLALTTEELNYSLSLFVKEVRKPNGSEYAPDTIYYLVLGIQQYLYENGRIDNIFTDLYFESFTNCLDEVAKKFSVLYNDSQYIVTRVEEEHLWECKQLGAHSPFVLLSTLMFFNTKHFNLTTVEEHMQLSFSHIMKHWKRGGAGGGKSAAMRNVLLRFYPPQAALDANTRKKKVYEQQENEENPLRCPVKLYEFYLSKCPESVKTRNDVFYLMPERSCVPDSPVWYSTQALGKEPLTKMLHRVKMVKEINIALLTS